MEASVCVVKCSEGVEASVRVINCSDGWRHLYGWLSVLRGVEASVCVVKCSDKHICALPYLASHIHSNATNQKRKFTLEKS